MRPFRTLIFAGAAVLAAVGAAAAAQHANVHVLKLQLPGGGSEVIRYTGDVAPQVTVSSDPMPAAPAAFPAANEIALDPMAVDWNAPFAMMQRMQAEMQQQSAALFQQARAMQAAKADPQRLLALAAPGVGQSLSFVSTMSGSGVCARSVQITSNGDGKPAKVVSKTYGDCVASGGAQGPAATAAAAQSLRQRDAVPVKTAPHAPVLTEQSGRTGI